MSLNQTFIIPDIKLNSKVFNPGKRRSKVDEANQLRDLKYQYFIKHEEDRKTYKAQRQFSSKDTQIKFSQYRDSASFLLLFKKAQCKSPTQLNKDLEYVDETELTLVEQERAREKVLTIDELIGEFAKDNQEQLKQFTATNTDFISTKPNQGIAAAIDKTFSRVEVEKSLSKNQRRLKSAQNALMRIKPKDKSIERWQQQKQQEFEDKLKQAIIDRIDDKVKFINNCDINDLVRCLKETKMSIENELDDLRKIKQDMENMNTSSAKDANQIDKKIQFFQRKIQKLAIITEENKHPVKKAVSESAKSKALKKRKMKDMDYGWKGVMKDSLDKQTKEQILKERESNKQYAIKEQLEFEGFKEKDFQIRQEFIRLRGDNGLIKSNLEQMLEEDMEEYYQTILNKKLDGRTTHEYFVSKDVLQENDKRRKKRAQLVGDSQDVVLSIPDSPIVSRLQFQRQEYIKVLQSRQEQERKTLSEKRSKTLNLSMAQTSQSNKKQTPLVAQRFFMGQQLLRQKKLDQQKQQQQEYNSILTKEKYQTMQSTNSLPANQSMRIQSGRYQVQIKQNLSNSNSRIIRNKENEDVTSNQSYMKNNSCQIDDTLTVSPYSIGIKTFSTSKKELTMNTQSHTTLANSKGIIQRPKSIYSNLQSKKQNVGNQTTTNSGQVHINNFLRESKNEAISESFDYEDMETNGDIVVVDASNFKNNSRPQTSHGYKPSQPYIASRMTMSGGFKRPFSSKKIYNQL